jgi:Icc-related predicted phosphoesterase
MKLLVMSDLHFEFHRDGGRAFCERYRDFDGYDVAVIAGDLCDFKSLERSWDLVDEAFKQTVSVCGNHELYGASLAEFRDESDYLFEFGHMNWLLERGYRAIGDQRFIGCTLWFPHDETGRRLEWTMNDFELIRGLSGEVDRLHRQSKEWLWDTLTRDDVLVTHHLPSWKSVHPKYAGSNLNRFFVGDIEELIRRRQPKLVVHGHTHESFDYRIGDTRVVCNPLGYVGREVNPNFVERMVVEV